MSSENLSKEQVRKITGDTSLTLFAKEEAKRLEIEAEKRKAKYMEEHDLKPYYKWKNGTNRFDINADKPMQESEGKYGQQSIFRVKNEKGEENDLYCPKDGKVYTIIMNGLAKGQLHFAIDKSGEGKKTQYEVHEED